LTRRRWNKDTYGRREGGEGRLASSQAPRNSGLGIGEGLVDVDVWRVWRGRGPTSVIAVAPAQWICGG